MDMMEKHPSRRNMLNKTNSLTPRSPQKRGVASSATTISSGLSTTRIYRAPQASIRSDPRRNSKDSKSARRRRWEIEQKMSALNIAGNAKPVSPLAVQSGLEAPCLWMDEMDESQSPDLHHFRGSPRQRRTVRSVRNHFQLRSGSADDISETLDGDETASVFTSHTQYSYDKYAVDERKKHVTYRFLVNNLQGIVQIVVIVVLGTMIFDSHHRVQKHKVELQRYDEERAHILEQMMWIDQAAKKVHKKYAQKELWDNVNGEDLLQETKDQLRQEAEGLRDAVKKLQLRVQLNARDRIAQRFAENPVQVSLSLDPAGTHHLVLRLSDDTPHAAQTLLEQIDKKLWDNIELQRLESGAIQVSTSTSLPTTSPVLEFVESSKSCHEVGSVVLHELEAEAMDLNVVVLRIHMEENTRILDGDVCIGKVISGLDYLKEVEGIPLIADRNRLS